MAIAIQETQPLVKWLQEVIRRDASDLFFFPGEPPTFRGGAGNIDKIGRCDEDPLTAEQTRELAVAAFGEEQLSRLGAEVSVLRGICTVEAEEAVSAPESGVRFAVMVGMTQGDISIAARMIPWRIFTPEQIAVPSAVLEASSMRRGLIVFSGNMGSGMITVAACVLDHINASRDGHICVVGDPVEYMFEPKRCLVQHKEIGIDAPDSVSAIGGAFDQDLDVLYFQYLRSAEELEACLTIARNRLVITVIHADSADDALQRMAHLYPPDLQPICRAALAGTVRCVVNQRLLQRANGKGRVAAYEVAKPDGEMRAAIAEGRGVFEDRTPLPEGCQTMAGHLGRLRDEGTIPESESGREPTQ